MRLLILQCVLLVGRVWLQLPSRLGMQLKVQLVHKYLSRLGIQLNDPVYTNLCTQICVHIRKFTVPSIILTITLFHSGVIVAARA